MENNKASIKKNIINYGVLLGITSVLLGVVIYVMNAHLDPNWIFSVIGILILVGIISYGIKAYKKVNEGYLNLSEALKIGIGIALIGGIIVAIWTFILTTVIEPDYTQQMLDIQREKLLENPDMSEQMVNQSMAIVEKMSGPYIQIALSIIANLFFGFIISLFAGLAMQKKQDLY
jgi:preprotein translocase subunit YajC